MIRKIFAIIIVAIVAVAVFVPGCGGGSDDKDTGEYTIPIQVNNADGVGALRIELVYDSSIIEVVDVTLGNLGENGQVDYEVESHGRVIIGFIDAMGMSGAGEVVEIEFTKNSDGKSSLALENVVATDAETLYDLVVNTTPGSLDTAEGDHQAPVINLGL